ncbi:hypothetical protein ACFO3U_00065 [Flavobacterium ponti]|uniref:Uncharacterized protein n=1 Tax=Flavobacterium ponti TaxID=665133 RepID=A0ABV9NYF1_9FLAO
MKKHYKILLLFISILILVGWKTIQNNEFVYQIENQKIMLRIESGMNFLRWNEKAKLILNTENIDSRKLSLSAPGLRNIKGATIENTESIWEINISKQTIKNDTLKLFISCRNQDDRFWSHQFKIPIKE